eukprot:11917396-Alexandrium_andersonii.AAC.2
MGAALADGSEDDRLGVRLRGAAVARGDDGELSRRRAMLSSAMTGQAARPSNSLPRRAPQASTMARKRSLSGSAAACAARPTAASLLACASEEAPRG